MLRLFSRCFVMCCVVVEPAVALCHRHTGTLGRAAFRVCIPAAGGGTPAAPPLPPPLHET